jgi:hypothetical protein
MANTVVTSLGHPVDRALEDALSLWSAERSLEAKAATKVAVNRVLSTPGGWANLIPAGYNPAEWVGEYECTFQSWWKDSRDWDAARDRAAAWPSPEREELGCLCKLHGNTGSSTFTTDFAPDPFGDGGGEMLRLGLIKESEQEGAFGCLVRGWTLTKLGVCLAAYAD